MNKLEQERQECLDRMRALMDAAQNENRELSEEEQKQFDEAKARVDEINATIEKANKQAEELEEMENRSRTIRARAVNPLPRGNGTFDAGQNLRDVQKFSFTRALNLMLSNRNLDGVEAEVFAEGAKEAQARALGFSPTAKIIPMSAIRALCKKNIHNRADFTVSGTSGGTVATDVHSNIWDMFRSRLVLSRLGATVFDNLTGNLKLPTQTSAGGDLGFIGETAAATELDPDITTPELSPHRVSAYTNISTQMTRQSTPDVEAFITRNLIETTLRVIENSVFNGGSSDAVVGIPNMTGVNLQNVATANAPTWGEVLKMQGDTIGAGVPVEALGYALNGTIATTLMSTKKGDGVADFIMDEGVGSDGIKSLAGYKAAVSNLVGSNIIFGIWERLFIGQWGGIAMLVNPYTNAKNGKVEIVAETFADAKVGNPANFTVLSMAKAS